MIAVLVLTFLIGCVCGLRSMTAPAVVCWGAHLGWLALDGSPLAFLHNPISLGVFSALAVGELIGDKLPSIPNRTKPGPLVVRIFFGALAGAALCIAAHIALAYGIVLGGAGGVVGAYAGYSTRRALSSRLPDVLVALVEDAIAVGGGFLIVSRF